MPPDERVLAVVVNWNGREVLPQTLEALRTSLHPQLEIVVVDNGSTDGSAAAVRDPERLVPLPENLGYAGALNQVLRPALEGENGPGAQPPGHFLLLNNDVLVEPETITRLLETAREKGPGIYGPKVLLQGRPDRLDAAWGRITWSHVLCYFRGKGARDGPRFDRVRRVQLLLGCALLVHRRVFREVGLFDERFFMYHEEVDFLFRAGRRGYPAYYCPAARVRHRRAHSTRSRPLRRVEWVRRNTVLFLRKHRAGAWAWGCWGKTLVLSLLYNLLLLRLRRVAAIWRGVGAACFTRSGVFHAPGSASFRRRERRVSRAEERRLSRRRERRHSCRRLDRRLSGAVPDLPTKTKRGDKKATPPRKRT